MSNIVVLIRRQTMRQTGYRESPAEEGAEVALEVKMEGAVVVDLLNLQQRQACLVRMMCQIPLCRSSGSFRQDVNFMSFRCLRYQFFFGQCHWMEAYFMPSIDTSETYRN